MAVSGPVNLFTLIYTSTAYTKVTSASLCAIAENAAKRNARVGVTGLLLYGSGQYFQLIEGSQSTVKMLYRRIAADNRHQHLRLLFESKLNRRVFPEWHMGQLNLDEPDLRPSDLWGKEAGSEQVGLQGDATPREQAIAWVRKFMASQSVSDLDQSG